MITRTRGFPILERFLLSVGLVLVAVWLGALTYRALASRLALRKFEQAQVAALQDCPPHAKLGSGDRDSGIFPQKPLSFFHDRLSRIQTAPLAVIRIDRVNIRVPVFEGTDELALNSGVGWIAATARPGEAGNIGIAGHRDGFFRGLKDVSPGDAIELSTVRETAVYKVDQIEIVAPEDVSVLRTRAVPSLTLVTCYPFYFTGHAPKRYVLHASLTERAANTILESGSPQREPDNSTTRR